MARIHGKTGNLYASILTIHNCDAAFDELVDGDATATADTADYQEGAASNKLAVAAGLANGDIIATDVITSKDLSAYSKIIWKAKSSVDLAAADVQLLIDNTAECASPVNTLDFPALTADTWKTCSVAATLTGATAIISVGVKLTANDPGAFNLWLDNIMAAKSIAGIKSWTIDYSVDIADGRGFDDAGAPHPVVGATNWSGSFDGYKDGAPLGIGTRIYLELGESATSTQKWHGQAVIKSVNANVSIDGLVSYSYTFDGQGTLEVPTA